MGKRGLGLEAGVVRVVEYDTRWPEQFVAECEWIRARCGSLPLRLEHIGGTSIPDMCAKPILDIAAARSGREPSSRYVSVLKAAGYEHRGEVGISGREFFCRGNPRTHHLHLVEEGSRLWHEYLVFRDYLRANANARHQFATMKRSAAAAFSKDREGYLEAKSTHVQEILRRAGAPRIAS